MRQHYRQIYKAPNIMQHVIILSDDDDDNDDGDDDVFVFGGWGDFFLSCFL